jgi:hypothetical protein
MTDVNPPLTGDNQNTADMGEGEGVQTSSGEPRAFAGGTPQPPRRRVKPASAPGGASASASGASSPGTGSDETDESLLVAGIETAQAKADELRRWADVKTAEASERIRANPIGSAAVIFGVGLLAGMFLNRR